MRATGADYARNTRVAVITSKDPCPSCAEMLAQWAEDQAGDPT